MPSILRTRYVTMHDMIDVDVIDVILQIALVADNVSVKCLSPDAALASRTSTG